jgi:flagellar basal-body rod modification protein FlgD
MVTTPVTTTVPAGHAALTAAGGQLGKEEFLQLLVAQLRNQDPLNPMQPQDMAAQLAQFSSVEQLLALNERMAVQNAYSEAIAHGLGTGTALGVLGRTVLARTDQVAVGKDGIETITVEIGESGGTARLKLLDANGKEVGSRDLGFLAAGRHTVEVGKAADGLEDGVYTIAVDVVDDDGNAVAADTFIRVRIDGVRNTDRGIVLAAGALELHLQDIVEVFFNS